MKAGTTTITGASQNIDLSADAGSMSSFRINLRASATGWSSPMGPVRVGPRRRCNRPSTLRSSQTKDKNHNRQSNEKDQQRQSVPQDASDADGHRDQGGSHRSTSPSTMSKEPRITTESATQAPWSIVLIAERLQNDGGLTLTR